MTAPARNRVLVLDAQLRHAVTIVRRLGLRQIPVVAGGSRKRFPARYSRYTTDAVVLDPRTDGDPLGALRSIIDRHEIGVVIPAGLPGNELICRHRDVLEPLVRAPFNDVAQFLQLSNKDATVALARSLGVPVPATATIASPGDARAVAEEIGFPMVFKSPIDQGTVRYPRTLGDLERLTAEFFRANTALVEQGIHPLVQEYIEGEGHGFYALADRGRILAYFMHRRLHEVPPTGGASAMAGAFRDPELAELGGRFFAATRWHGVAMVEFKRSRRDGRYYLIEVNPKFWGSLDLGVAAGVDFPYLLHRMLAGEDLGVAAGEYRDDTVFRWLTMDLSYAVATHDIGGYLRTFRDSRVLDDFERTDPLPTAALFARGLCEELASRRKARGRRAVDGDRQ